MLQAVLEASSDHLVLFFKELSVSVDHSAPPGVIGEPTGEVGGGNWFRMNLHLTITTTFYLFRAVLSKIYQCKGAI